MKFRNVFTKEEDIPGYTKKIIVPEDGLSEKEKQYLDVISRITETLSLTKDVETIATRINTDCEEIWGNIINTSIDIDFQMMRGIGVGKCVYLIRIKGPLIIEGMERKTGVIIPPGEVSNQEFWFYISGTSSITGIGKHLALATIYPVSPTRSMECVFYPNGRLRSLYYKEKMFTQADVIKTWSKDGKFLKSEILKKPRPMPMKGSFE